MGNEEECSPVGSQPNGAAERIGVKLPRAIHRWDVTPRRAIALQRELAGGVVRRTTRRRFQRVAGADIALTPDGARCVAGVVVWDAIAQQVIEEVTATRRLTFPYVPGLLSFREAPAVLAAIRKLKTEPDAFLFDGQGYAHPRRLGLACHVGLFIDRPSVGCAKSRLTGEHAAPGTARGATVPLYDGDERIGAVVRTRPNVTPVYVSVGHRMDLERAVELVLACANRYRLPEPTRLADQLVGRLRYSC
jgi:deoxyribonuclease V